MLAHMCREKHGPLVILSFWSLAASPIPNFVQTISSTVPDYLSFTGTTRGCERHKCKLNSCTDIRSPRSLHCSYHLCSHTGCKYPRKGDTLVRQRHLCQMQGCVSPCENTPGSKACGNHVCQEEMCQSLQTALGLKFCNLHSCRWPYTPCPETVLSGARFFYQ